jgi:branched-subunit amino acid aminotransferase/4-amino-4-deoxychorismate lyase
MQSQWAYVNGRWYQNQQLAITIDDQGFMFGATVVERLRTFAGRVFRLDDHLERMHHSLTIVGLDADVIRRDLREVIPECSRRNQSPASEGDDLAIVAFCTPGADETGPPTVCVHAEPLPFARWAHLYDDGLTITISDVRQVPDNCWPPDLKCRSRMHYYLAERHARERQPGARAVLLDQEGYVGEATTANVLIFRRDEGLISPPRERILPGVTLKATEELAAELGVPFTERLFTPQELQAADEVLLVSTSICVLPVVACDKRPLGTGRPGTTYRTLLGAWNRLVGIDIAGQARQFAARSKPDCDYSPPK